MTDLGRHDRRSVSQSVSPSAVEQGCRSGGSRAITESNEDSSGKSCLLRSFYRPSGAPGIDILSAWQNESLSVSPWGSGRLIDRCDGWMDGWMDGWSDGQAEADSLERQKHELLELLGDVPLIAATTVAVSQLAARRMASPSVGEKGYLPLNTLNKMNRRRGRAQKGGREKRKEMRRGDRFFRCPVWHPRRSRARLSQNLLSIRAGRCTMLGRQRQAAAGGDGTVSERDRMTD